MFKDVEKLHFILASFLLVQNIKRKTWRYVSKYRLCIFYVSFFNLIYYILCKNFLMWDFKSKIFQPKIMRALHILVINPLLILLYLSDVPTSLHKKVIYISKWVVISTLIEWTGKKIFKMIVFDHGWHIGWSMCIYIKMYILSLLMTKRPLLTWMISMICTVYFLSIFKVPVKNNMKEYLREWRIL